MADSTPGPWWWDGKFPIHIRSADLFVCGHMYPSQIGDAYLIAAAPELLDALIGMYSLVHDMGWTAPDDRYHSIVRAASVIAKATTGKP